MVLRILLLSLIIPFIHGKTVYNNPCSPTPCGEHTQCPNASTPCGVNADCKPLDDLVALCSCPPHYTGDPLVSCRKMDPEEVCHPNPCGQNTKCEVRNFTAVCSCLPKHFGDPLTYCQQGECDRHSDCGQSQVCRNHSCVDVCSVLCGVNAECKPRNHGAACSCPPYYTGNPLFSCKKMDSG